MNKYFVILLSVLTVTFFSSCVKESRENCPCYLLFAHEGFDANGYEGDINLLVFENSSKTNDDVYDIGDMVEDRCDIAVKKGFPDVCGVGGLEFMDLHGIYDLVIPYGYQCDPIYAFHDDVVAQGERALVFGEVNKQHANVFLDVNIISDEEVVVKVVGNTNGLDIRTMEPLEGYFGYVSTRNEEGIHVFRLPRQRDSNLDIEIWNVPEGYRPSDHSMTGCTKLTSLNIGSLIVDKLKYDWKADSLSDIYIDVDFIKSTVTFRIKEWNIVEIFSIDV